MTKYIYLGDRLTTQEFKNKTCVAVKNKPFNPEELVGFKETDHSIEFDMSVREYCNNKYTMRYFEKECKIWVLDSNKKIIVNLIKIPNHRFAVELLQNLGVID